jgi:hypothetical protein
VTDLAMLALVEADVEDGRLIEVEEKRGILPFYIHSVPAGTIFNVNVSPQLEFTPRRLVYGGDKNTFLLIDIKVGINSQMIAPGTMAMECFPPHPELGRPIDNLVGMDKCHISQLITMTIQNVSDRSAPFSAIIYGAIR